MCVLSETTFTQISDHYSDVRGLLHGLIAVISRQSWLLLLSFSKVDEKYASSKKVVERCNGIGVCICQHGRLMFQLEILLNPLALSSKERAFIHSLYAFTVSI